MRLLISSDTFGGVWDYTVTLANAAASDGHSVLLAAYGQPDEGQLESLSEDVVIESRRIPLEWAPASADELLAGANWLSSLARAWRADVAHLNQMTPPGIARFASPTLVVVHSDVCSWMQAVHGQLAAGEWAGYTEAVRSGLAAATTVVTISMYQASLTGSHFGRSPDRIIYNGLNAESGAVEPPGPEPLLLAAGRAWDEAKGFHLLDAALGMLDSPPPAHLLGATEGPQGQRFSSERLVHHGQMSNTEVRSWMEKATIFVAPSVYEPFGLAPLEASLNGCALLLSDIGSFRELWNGCAEFFPSGDATGLADAIQRLVADPGRVQDLALAAYQRATEAYNGERFASEYLALYHQVAAAHDPIRAVQGAGKPSTSGSPAPAGPAPTHSEPAHLED